MTVTEREDTGTLAEVEDLEPPQGKLALYELLVPVVAVLAGFGALYLLLEGTLRRNVFAFLGAYILPGGIDYGIPLAVQILDLEPWWILGLVTYFDLWITLFWVWNFDHLVRFQWMEERVHKSRAKAHKLWERFPWLRVASGPGLALFILLPIPWTGSFGGIVVGKLIELPDRVIFFASVAGTAMRVSALAWGWAGLFSLF
ncbi:MAG: small multi-drug export protein [Candidatus Thermoplasmatota archaeon]|nr:small multi-drug export protein [Candidatus Thermoplasmatota archaeon]